MYTLFIVSLWGAEGRDKMWMELKDEIRWTIVVLNQDVNIVQQALHLKLPIRCPWTFVLRLPPFKTNKITIIQSRYIQTSYHRDDIFIDCLISQYIKMNNSWLYGNMYTNQPMRMLNSGLPPPIARGPQSYLGGRPQTQHFADHTTYSRVAWGTNRPAAMQPRARQTAYMYLNAFLFVFFRHANLSTPRCWRIFRDYANLPQGWGPKW